MTDTLQDFSVLDWYKNSVYKNGVYKNSVYKYTHYKNRYLYSFNKSE